MLRTCHFDSWNLAQQLKAYERKRGHDDDDEADDDDDDGQVARSAAEAEAEAGRAALRACRERNEGMLAMRESGRDGEVVGAIFGNIAAVAAGGALEAVVLEAGVFDGLGQGLGHGQGGRMAAWEVRSVVEVNGGVGFDGRGLRREKVRLWEAMAHDFGVVLGAVVRAGVRVGGLRVYGGEWGGSVGAKEVGEAMDAVPRGALERWLAEVRVLSGFVSFGGLEDLEVESWGDEAASEGLTNRIGEFLGMAKGLEELDLLLYTIRRSQGGHQRFFHGVVAPIVGERIRSIRLRGFKARAVDLLDLIRKCRQLEELELQEVILRDGKWSAVFELLHEHTSKLRRLTMYRLYERLYERRPPIVITRPEDCKLQPQSLAFDALYQMNGEQVRSGVEYSLNMVRPKASGGLLSYRLRTRKLYIFS